MIAGHVLGTGRPIDLDALPGRLAPDRRGFWEMVDHDTYPDGSEYEDWYDHHEAGRSAWDDVIELQGAP